MDSYTFIKYFIFFGICVKTFLLSEMSRAVVLIALLVLVEAEFPAPFERELLLTSEVSRNVDETVYRLPTTVFPVQYDIYIDLYFNERTDRPFSYDGRENIVIQATEAVSQIVLHANVDKINDVKLFTADGATVALNETEPYAVEEQYHFLKVNVLQSLEINVNYTLAINYTGTMNEGPMKRGIWRGWYRGDDGVERVYATTHFQPYNARQAFPCWDEPLFKAVFTLHLSRPYSYIGRFSNTVLQTVDILENNRVRDNFLTTPIMSSYLVTFLVSETLDIIAEDTSFNPPVRIIGRPNTANNSAFALDLAVTMTQYFSEYFDYSYDKLHPSLMNDHISSPDWASAGTENWGMVSYRELYMAIDSRETLMSVEHYAATLLSHELAHKWFGNLVTCFWWSNTWINEAFASYFGYAATYQRYPKYQHNDHFNSRYLQTSLSYDSSASSEPMNYEVNTPAQVTRHFGTISYSKGASILRQTVNIIGEQSFRKACQLFLMENAYEPADQYDLLKAFDIAIKDTNALDGYLNFNFTEYYRVWVNEPGYPVLVVNINYNTGEMALSQERFYLSSSVSPNGEIYPIPITYSTKSNKTFDQLKPSYMMTSERIVLQKPVGEEWVIFNNQQNGYYRVFYDTKNWELLAKALLDNPEDIHYLNRAQIVDDVFAFMRSGRMTYSFGFNILKFLRNEINYHVWDPAISGYTWIRNRLRHMPEEQAQFDAFVLSYLEHVIDQVGFDTKTNESPTFTMTRQVILHFACLLGHAKCIEESFKRFEEFRTKETWVSPGIRRNVFTVGIREGGEVEYTFLLQKFMSSNLESDKLEILRGLASTKDSVLLNRYLLFTLTKEVRTHDKVNSFNYALLGNRENAATVLQFVKSNIDNIRVSYIVDSPANPVQSALTNLASYLDEPGLVEYEEWLRNTQSASAQFNSTLSAIASARNNMAWGTANADMILAAARDGATKVVTSFVMLLVMAAVALLAK